MACLDQKLVQQLRKITPENTWKSYVFFLWYNQDMKTNTKIMIGIVVVVAAVIIIVFTKGNSAKKESIETVAEVTETTVMGTSPLSTFAWRYEKGAEDLDGLPKTIIFLDTTYQNGKVVTIQVEEVQGSCNDVDPLKEDTDMVEGTIKVLCYAAGFGEQYKIVKGAESYQIVRKYIEEGDPEVKPTVFQYEKIVEFPLFQ